jgi:hypothetical protein
VDVIVVKYSFWSKLMNTVLLRILLIAVIVITGVTCLPAAIADWGASPEDRGREDLSRIEYPSLSGISWRPYFIRPQDSIERLFGEDWIALARFNRLDRRHAYPGVTIKVPDNIDEINDYPPLPLHHQPAKAYPRYILLHVAEQWLGAYEFGKLKFSMPAATGVADHLTPTGIFRIDVYDRRHSSSLYKTEKGDMQYPMDYALRFHVADGTAFWIHARDIPGRPASHGCIGLAEESMQKRIYGDPVRPILSDARKLYGWVLGAERLEQDTGGAELLPDGPVVEITGDLPRYLDAPPRLPPWQGRED